MALIVEDGTGLSTAESYISVADADTYIAAYKSDVTAWDAATTTAKEIAAREATQYIDGLFNWLGTRLVTTQALDWPRQWIYDDLGVAISGIPTNLERATAEAMYLIIGGESLVVNVSQSTQLKRAKVDVIEVEYVSGASYQTTYPVIARLLADYIVVGGRVVRA